MTPALRIDLASYTASRIRAGFPTQRALAIDLGIDEVRFSNAIRGARPMTPDLLARAIRWCKRKLAFPYVFLTTNGSLCTTEILQGVFEAGLDSLKFSVNAATPEQFAEVMGVKPSLYEDALNAIKLARQLRDSCRYDCGIYASSIQYDGEQQLAMEALLSERVRPYVDQHYWLPLYSMGSLATQR